MFFSLLLCRMTKFDMVYQFEGDIILALELLAGSLNILIKCNGKKMVTYL
jgi:hypothetical protein